MEVRSVCPVLSAAEMAVIAMASTPQDAASGFLDHCLS